MAIFTNYWGETATTWEEIISKTINHMDEEDLIQELRYQELENDIIKWALKQDAFHSEFNNYIEEAKQVWAGNAVTNYFEEDDEPADIDSDCGFDPYMGCYTDDC